MTKEEVENIKFRLSDIGVKVGELALEYISELEKENAELKEFAEKLSEQHADEWQKQQEVITELKEQIKSFENDFDYQNKVIEKYKEDLKKLRIAYIQAQVANVISGTDFETILKNVLNRS